MASDRESLAMSSTESVAEHPLNRLSPLARIGFYFGGSVLILAMSSALVTAAGGTIGWRSLLPIIVLLVATSALMDLERRMPRPASPWVRRAAAARDAVLAAALSVLTVVFLNPL
jgi:hypothetical protein